MSDLPADRAALAQRFRAFAEHEGRGASPLYERLCVALADDAAILALAAEATTLPVPNLLLGAVQYLLFAHPGDPLAAFYPSLTATPATGDPYPAFRAFCLAQQTAITRILQTRRVQTNEVRRCACLLPAFGLVAAQAAGRPLALIEIGASAGFNLLWDHYGYEYGVAGQAGDPQAALQLHCEVRGGHQLPIPQPFPTVAGRLGIDLHPIDVRDPQAMAWLRALIWPEHADRRTLLDAAAATVLADSPALRAGDALALLPSVLAHLPADVVPCVFHSFTLNQFAPQDRDRLTTILAACGTRRDCYRISIEMLQVGAPELRLEQWHAGRHHEALLARCNPHGAWIEWLA